MGSIGGLRGLGEQSCPAGTVYDPLFEECVDAGTGTGGGVGPSQNVPAPPGSVQTSGGTIVPGLSPVDVARQIEQARAQSSQGLLSNPMILIAAGLLGLMILTKD